MAEKRPAILDITEEQIFKTLGRGVPMCTLLNEADSNAIRSMAVIDLALKQIAKEHTEQIRGLEIVRDRQITNLEDIRKVKRDMKC